MKVFVSASALFAVFLASCSSGPSSPAAPSAQTPSAFMVSGGTVTADAVTATRMRLRIVGGGDIATGLQSGQSINVPIKQKLDVWAEIQRLETDRARLVVDWGNGNNDFSGCGACRLENIYEKAGRYTLTARVLDLNDTTGTPVALATVIINAVEPEAACSGPTVSADFEGFALGALAPFNVAGATFTAPGGGYIDDYTIYPGFTPFLITKFFYVTKPQAVITFANNRNDFRAGLGAGLGATISYEARNDAGVVVRSGIATLGSVLSGGVAGSVAFDGALFRSVTLTITGSPGDFGVDNVIASCR